MSNITQTEFKKIMQELIEIRTKKNNDYGDGFLYTYQKYGNKAVFFDLLRKWQRIENILFNETEIKVTDETLQDTLGDLAIMAVNAMVYFNKRGK